MSKQKAPAAADNPIVQVDRLKVFHKPASSHPLEVVQRGEGTDTVTSRYRDVNSAIRRHPGLEAYREELLQLVATGGNPENQPPAPPKTPPVQTPDLPTELAGNGPQ